MRTGNSGDSGRSKREENIGFEEAVTEVFGPIMNTLGFHMVSVTPSSARFESGMMYIHIGYGVYDSVIDFTIGGEAQSGRREHVYTSFELMNVKGFHGPTPAVAHSGPEILRRLRELADFVTEYCVDALKGDMNTLDQLDKAVTQFRLAYGRRLEVTSIRARADRAWQGHDYDEVYRLYKQIDLELTAEETERYEYAYKVISGIST